MKKEELAALLNGRKHGNEISDAEERRAKDAGLVVVFGYSDDNIEFRGAICNEVGSYGSIEMELMEGGHFSENEDGDPVKTPHTKTISALWSPEELDCAWLIKSDIPHATFDTLEDGDLFCRGIVFELKSLGRVMSGVELIAQERQRQIEKEGWTQEHDERYTGSELLQAARCYTLSSEACHSSTNNITYGGGYRPDEGVPSSWPWADRFWKPTGDPVRDLVKAGALIAAEIDRLQAVGV